jgi:hypothetical protein
MEKPIEKLAKDALEKEAKRGGNPLNPKNICKLNDNEIEKVFDKKLLKSGALSQYIPASDKPLTFICINLHIFQDSAGLKNYNKSHVKDFKAIFDWINGYQTNYHQPNYNGICTSRPNIPQQIDSRIRFILNRIEFYKDDALCNQGGFNYQPLKNAMLQRDSDMDNQLNIFFTDPDIEQGYAGYTQFPSTNLSNKQYIHSFRNRLNPTPPFWLSQHWSHELGHVLGLNHTYNTTFGGGGPNCNENDPMYLYDIFGCPPDQQCPISTNIPNNNIMGGKESWSISTLQIAKMHYSLNELSVKQYANNLCCPKCVAFGAKIHRHKSEGAGKILEYEQTTVNVPHAWDGKHFTCPVEGIYQFSLSYQKDSLVDGGTPNDIFVKLWADSDLIGTVWSEKADRKSGWSPFSWWWHPWSKQQFGRRDSVSISLNIKLKKGTVIKTEIGSHNNEKRHIVDVIFCGNLLCSEGC